eukprot:TRINITY_DN11197_c0_g1_i1.p1 TRINITY_DN11197_c0_g1~~TRINITY_DN11197_c0_g1_i1.p1  ORF type:complete len:243 (-),score=60.40 TRINITY_DN11197_c0_g1_i1:297-1025(-)
MLRFIQTSVLIFLVATQALCNRRDLQSPRNIFLDLGANNGASLEFFFGKLMARPDLGIVGARPESELFGKGKQGSWIALAIEANNRFTPDLQSVASNLTREFPESRISIINGTAVGVIDGKIDFYLDSEVGREGSSALPQSNVYRKIQVDSIAIQTLFAKLSIHPRDFVILKMDIEGAEFPVIRQLIAEGLLPMVDVMAIEWHNNNGPLFKGNKSVMEHLSKQKACLQWILSASKVRLIRWF